MALIKVVSYPNVPSIALSSIAQRRDRSQQVADQLGHGRQFGRLYPLASYSALRLESTSLLEQSLASTSIN